MRIVHSKAESWNLREAIAAMVFVAPLIGSSIDSTAAETSRGCTADAMIVFDASGSMAATDVPEQFATRIGLVKQALRQILPTVSPTRKLGLVVYGPGKSYDVCRNVDLRFPPKPNAGNEILSQVERLNPAGQTPLTKGVRIAADALSSSNTGGAIVLLTDGEETCGGDPCLLAHALHTADPDIVVHIIGYKLQLLNGEPSVPGAKCLADETGGHTVNADTLDELVKALAKMLGCPAVASNAAFQAQSKE